MITLGIDIGTTHIKVLALDTERAEVVVTEAAPTPIARSADGEAHQPGEVLDTVLALVAYVTRQVGDATDVAAVCVASVGEEVVLLDAGGTPVGETIAWYDPRGFDQAEAFMRGPGGATALSERWPPDATFSLFKLMWVQEHRASELAAAVTWTDLGDYVLAGLGGDTVMDWSHASRAGAFDLATRAWDRASIEAAALDIEFPRLVASGTPIGTLSAPLARQLGLSAGTTLVSGGHDHLCAAFGAGVRSTSELFLSAGTSEAHLALLRAPLEGDAARRVDQGCFVDGDSYYLHINIHSGHFFQGWRELLYPGEGEDKMYADVAASTPGAEGIRFELTDGLRHGRLDHVPYDADRAAIMRAVLEGLATRSAVVVDELERASGRPYELILVAGHPTRVPLWRELRTAAYGRPMAAVDEAEPTAYGAAVMAALATGAPGADALVAKRVPWDTANETTGRA